MKLRIILSGGQPSNVKCLSLKRIGFVVFLFAWTGAGLFIVHQGWQQEVQAMHGDGLRFITAKKSLSKGKEIIKELERQILTAAERVDFSRLKQVLEKVRHHHHDQVNLNARDETGNTALMHAAAAGSVEMVELLLDEGAFVDARSQSGATALFSSTAQARVGVVKLLLAKGADVLAKDDDGKTALSLAAALGNVEIAKLLLDKGVPIDGVDIKGFTALMYAASGDAGSASVVGYLLERGANANAKAMAAGGDGEWWSSHSALMLAARNENLKTFKLLIKHGAEISGCNYQMCTEAEALTDNNI